MNTERRIAIVLGPTPGHVYPALAVASAYRAAADVTVLFIDAGRNVAAGNGAGTTGDSGTSAVAYAAGAHDTVAPGAGGSAPRVTITIPGHVEAVRATPLAGGGLGARLRASADVARGFRHARRLLRAHRVRLVIGLGAYVSGAVVLAARSLGARVALLEANVVPGLANRLLRPFADRVYLGHEEAAPWFPAARRRTTGHPVRAEIAALATESRRPPSRDRPARVLVVAASRDGGFMARQVPDLLGRIVHTGLGVDAFHLGGDAPPDSLREAYRRAGVVAKVAPHLDDMASAYRWADFLVARAGGGMLAELTVAGLPALLVPLASATHDHQTANARALAGRGVAWWTSERDWQPERLADLVAGCLTDPAAWAAASARARRAARPAAAAEIVRDCEAMMAGRW